MARQVFTKKQLAAMTSIYDVLIDKDMHWLNLSIHAGFAHIYLYEIGDPNNIPIGKLISQTSLYSIDSNDQFNEKMKRFHQELSKAAEASNKSMAVRKKERGDYVFGTKKEGIRHDQ